MDIAELVKLTERAWSLEILAALHREVPARRAPLVAAIGAGRTAFAASLQHLLDLGMLERNPGHGHPLRPEFRLTEKGERLASLAATVIKIAPDPPALGLLRKRWTVPVLSVAQAPRRFSEIRFDLGQVTDRALSQAIQQLQSQGWMDRQVDQEARPLRAVYQATNGGLEIAKIISAQKLREVRE